MSPRSTTTDIQHHCVSDGVIARDCLRRFSAGVIAATNLDNVAFCQFGQMAPLAMAGAMLASHIFGVFFSRSEKEMGRVHTWSIVASVQNIEAGGDSTMREFPRQSMRQNGSLSVLNAPIPVLINSAGVDPAGTGFIDKLPEAIRDWARRMAVALLVAISASAAATLRVSEAFRSDNRLIPAIAGDVPITALLSRPREPDNGEPAVFLPWLYGASHMKPII